MGLVTGDQVVSLGAFQVLRNGSKFRGNGECVVNAWWGLRGGWEAASYLAAGCTVSSRQPVLGSVRLSNCQPDVRSNVRLRF
jgi:hypothetical protein